MSTFGVTKYGAGVYGVADANSNLIWGLEIAWSGTYNGDNEAMRMVDCTVRRGRSDWVSDDGFQPFDQGEAVCILENDDERYWALNTSSPLYPYVRPGPFARLYVIDGRGGTTYPIMRGYVEDIECYTQDGSRFARVILKHSQDWLKDKTASVATTTTEWIDEVMYDLLDDADWPWAEWTDELAGNTTALIYFYWQRQTAPLAELRALAATQPNILYCNRVGSIRFMGYQYTYDNEVAITSDTMLADLTLLQPWRSLRNRARVYAYPPATKNITATLWALADATLIPAGQTLTFIPTLEYNDYTFVGPASAITWDLTVNTQADGGGSDITSSCTTESKPGGSEVVVYNGNASNGYITKLEADVTGNVYVAPNDPSIPESNSTASQALYGVRLLTWDSQWLQAASEAASMATWLVGQLSGLQVEPEIQIETRPSLQFAGDLFVTRVDLDVLDIDAYFRIGHITHEWLSETGQAVRTTWKLEPYLTPWVPPA